MATAEGSPITAAFDWRQTGPQIWRIDFEAGDERYRFAKGGDDAALTAAGEESTLPLEYRAMYRRFVELKHAAASDVDGAPLQLVADAFLRGTMLVTERFEDNP